MAPSGVVLVLVLAMPAFADVDAQCDGPAEHARRPDPSFSIKGLGGFTAVRAAEVTGRDSPGFAGMLGVEYRLTSWLSLRSDVDFRPNGISWDALGLKLRIPWFIAPYVSVSATLGQAEGAFTVGPVGAAGFDLRLGRSVYLELEGAYRISPGEQVRRAGQYSVMAGIGWAFD